MKTTKKTFSFRVKLCKNYNSVEVGEGFEAELLDDLPIIEQMESFSQMKTELIERVKKSAEFELRSVNPEPMGENLLK